MKHFNPLKHCAVATVILSVTITAFAGGGGSAGRMYPATHEQSAAPNLGAAPDSAVTAAATHTPAPAYSAMQVKTRAQVSAELLQAEQMGIVPAGRIAYPGDPVTIARNQARFQRAEAYWRAHGELAAGNSK